MSNAAKPEDLIRIHHYGIEPFGMAQADTYFASPFECFEIISQRPFSLESVGYTKSGYWRRMSGSDSINLRIDNDGFVEIIATVGS